MAEGGGCMSGGCDHIERVHTHIQPYNIRKHVSMLAFGFGFGSNGIICCTFPKQSIRVSTEFIGTK